MKALFALLLLLCCGCTAEEIQMQETPLKLTSMKRADDYLGDNLTLEWKSLDGHISIVTSAPAQDSNLYVVGTTYARCFLQK
jgi:hypothetical protein